MSKYQKLLLFCAGADIECAELSTKSEIIKLTSIGKSILITTFFSSFSFFYAVYLISGSLLVSSLLSFVWGSFIFNIDRYIVSSMRGVTNKFDEFMLFIPRFLIAFFISLTIAVPIELLIFQEEIFNTLKNEESNRIIHESHIQKEYLEKIISPLYLNQDSYRKTILSLSNKIENCQDSVRKLRDSYICEKDGTCGQKKTGNGQKAHRQLYLYSEMNRFCIEENKRNSLEIHNLQKKIEDISEQIKNYRMRLSAEQASRVKEIRARSSGSLLTRITTLQKMSDSNITVKISVYMIMFLILSMELMPILVKFLSRKGAYDELVDAKEKETIINIRRNIQNSIAKNQLILDSEQKNIFEEVSNRITANKGDRSGDS